MLLHNINCPTYLPPPPLNLTIPNIQRPTCPDLYRFFYSHNKDRYLPIGSLLARGLHINILIQTLSLSLLYIPNLFHPPPFLRVSLLSCIEKKLPLFPFLPSIFEIHCSSIIPNNLYKYYAPTYLPPSPPPNQLGLRGSVSILT